MWVCRSGFNLVYLLNGCKFCSKSCLLGYRGSEASLSYKAAANLVKLGTSIFHSPGNRLKNFYTKLQAIINIFKRKEKLELIKIKV